DTRGFYTNRVVPPYLNEAMLMVKEGINPALIDNCAKRLGMPVGPLALTDETSLELGYMLMQSTKKELGADYRPNGVEDMLEKMVVDLGRKGRKSGGGLRISKRWREEISLARPAGAFSASRRTTHCRTG
ncbi:MAG: 3-hydroxyacyl-CoA dehydrogenase family protein, partial [Pseudomonadota bacterium]